MVWVRKTRQDALLLWSLVWFLIVFTFIVDLACGISHEVVDDLVELVVFGENTVCDFGDFVFDSEKKLGVTVLDVLEHGDGFGL